MRYSLSRCALSLCLAVTLASAGCRSGMGWSPSSWTNWGWGSGGTTTALAAKPPTTPPRPATGATPTFTSSVAANPGTASSGFATNPNYNTAASTPPGGYPTTSQPYGGNYTYPTQPASATATPGASNSVAPSIGYQTGPYQTSGAAPAGGAVGYGSAAPTGTGGYPLANSPASPYGASGGQSWNNSSSAGAATQPATDGYRTADQRNAFGASEASPTGGNFAQPSSTPPGYGQPSGGYSAPAAQPASNYSSPPSYGGASAGSPYGSYQPATQPSAATGPWQGYEPSTSTTNYGQSPAAGQSPATSPSTTGGYASPAATASTQPTTQPFTTPYSPSIGGATTSPAAASPASYSLPPSLATSPGGYKPGSTSGVQKAGYTQPGASVSSSAGGALYH